MTRAGHRVVVVGASLAGLHVCEGLRRYGYDGQILLVGEEDRLPYDRPPLSKEILTGTKVEADVDLVTPDRLALLEVEVCAGVRATGVDVHRKHVKVGSDVEPFDDLVIATGASARPLPGSRDLDGVHVLRTLSDAAKLRDGLKSAGHAVVIGGGYIGAEVASSARSLGVATTIVDPMPVMFSRGIGSHLGATIIDLHRRRGVDVRCGVTVAGLEGDGHVEAVSTSAGTIEADLVVVGIGAVPNTSWLHGSGLELADGVVCDSYCRARGAEGIWAAGDVARWEHPRLGLTRMEHWTNAVEQGAAVAQGICGDAERFEPLPYVWSDQHGKRIQCFGSIHPDDEMVIVDGELGTDGFVAVFGRAGRLVGVVALDGGRSVGPYRRLLAAGASWGDALAA